jgi:PhnB protein
MPVTSKRGGRQLVSLLPQLSVRGGLAALDFYRAAFGAEVVYQVGGTAGNPSVVAELSIEGAGFWVADESPEHANFSPESVGGATTKMLLIVDDPEAVIDRAVGAGASLVYPAGREHGWLLGRIQDPYGHHWEIGRPLIAWPPDHARRPPGRPA